MHHVRVGLQAGLRPEAPRRVHPQQHQGPPVRALWQGVHPQVHLEVMSEFLQWLRGRHKPPKKYPKALRRNREVS